MKDRISMKVVILAGGYGTRINEETSLRPKPLIKIGEKPIIWHIMKHYSNYGINEFIICCGYKGEMIQEYFMNKMMGGAKKVSPNVNPLYIILFLVCLINLWFLFN